MSEARYVPAAGRRGLNALYDPLLALTMRERSFRGAVIAELLAAPAPAAVADIGCGTGTLAVALAQRSATVRVVGVDGDEDVLARARAKAADAGVAERVELHEGRAEELPLGDGAADAAVLSLVLHHLVPSAKSAALHEAHRVLRPGGRLVVADWGRPRDPLASASFFVLQLLDGFADTAEHRAGELPARIAASGFETPRLERIWRTAWGSLELLVAERS